MPSVFEHVTSVPVPSSSAIAHFYESWHLADAFAIRLPAQASANPELLVRFIVAQQPAWIGWLTRVRDVIVARFGLKTAKQLASLADRIGVFKVYSANQREVVLGEDDKHLDFRVSLLCSGEAGPQGRREIIVSTVVQCHNRLGRTYLFIIAPFHRMVVRASLVRAARVGWPLAIPAVCAP